MRAVNDLEVKAASLPSTPALLCLSTHPTQGLMLATGIGLHFLLEPESRCPEWT